MAQSLGAILTQADRYFMGSSPLHDAARELGRVLDEAQIPYAIAGALALGVHGRRRLTEDVHVLIRREDLERFKSQWLGRGYVEITQGLRDTQRNVKIDFLISGDFPGDGKPKPICFPDPTDVGETNDDMRVLSLRPLIELKLASGMTAPHRAQDLVDVMELVRARALPKEYAESLDSYVRPKFLELWDLAQTKDDY